MAASAPVADERAEPGRGPLAAPVNGVPPQPAAHWVALEAFQPKGAKNLGNTCYMNVVLQALLQCQQLRSFFLSGLVPIPAPPQDSKIANITASERAESTYRILRALDSLVQAQYSNTMPKLVPSHFLSACAELQPTLRINVQEDAHEFLLIVLDVLDQVVLDADRARCRLVPKPPGHHGHSALAPTSDEGSGAASGGANGWVAGWDVRRDSPALASHIFGGMLQSDIHCECGKVSTRREPCMDVPLDFGHSCGNRRSRRNGNGLLPALEEPQAETIDVTAGGSQAGLHGDAPPTVVDIVSSQDLSSQCFAEAPAEEPSFSQAKAPSASAGGASAAPQAGSSQEQSQSASAHPADTSPSRSCAAQHNGAASPPASMRAPADALSREGSVGFVGLGGTADGSSRMASVRSSPSEVDMPSSHAAAKARAESEGGAETPGTDGPAKRQRTSPDAKQEGAQPPQDGTTLAAALQRLVSVETMAGYVCEGCRGTCTARKQLSLCKLPPVLIFHVKRFRHGIKVNETLAFAPEELLDMRPYTTAAVLGGAAALEVGGGQYRLDCLVEHIGRTMNGGHYIAYVRHGAQWLKCDDMKVSPVSPQRVQQAQAYLLVYSFQGVAGC